MKKSERDNLRDLALKATPGPWNASGKSVSRLIGTSNKGVAEAYGWAWTDYCEYWQTAEAAERDANYIAAASPDRVLALLDYVAELEDVAQRVVSAGHRVGSVEVDRARAVLAKGGQ